MIEHLTQLVRDNAADTIISNPAIPNEYNNAAIEQIALSIIESFRCQIIGGGLKEVLELFEGKLKAATHPVVLEMNNCVSNDLISKFGIKYKDASSVASAVLPAVIERLVKKTNDTNDATFDMKGVFAVIGGNAVNKNRASVFKSILADKPTKV